MSAGVPILTFHAIDDRPSVISFSPALFEQILGKLFSAGYRTLTLPETVRCIRQGQRFPDHSFVITFDDGYQSVYHRAFPLLTRYQFSATVFLTVGAEGSAGRAVRLPSLSGRPMLSWREIREMQKNGIDFGAHTLTHPSLPRLPADRAEVEISKSKTIIQDQLGASVQSFAYPFGDYDAQSLEIVRRYFDCACSADLGFITRRSPIYALERLDAYYVRSNRLMNLMQSRIFNPYIRARCVLRGVRRTLARTGML